MGGGYYSDEFECVGGKLYLQVGHMIWKDSSNLELDTDATMHGYITVTPLTNERTNLSVYETLKKINNV